MAKHKASISYDDVAEWWDNSEWFMSTYPPSAWHKYAEREGLTLEDIIENPAKLEDAVAEMASEGDGRTCECEWAEHETNCTWTPEEATND